MQKASLFAQNGESRREQDLIADCQKCAMRDELDQLRSKHEDAMMDLGGTYMTDILGPLPIKVTLYTRPTPEQWRRLIDLCLEIDESR